MGNKIHRVEDRCKQKRSFNNRVVTRCLGKRSPHPTDLRENQKLGQNMETKNKYNNNFTHLEVFNMSRDNPMDEGGEEGSNDSAKTLFPRL